MQYLECLSAALQDMAQTYQPASRMSVVLRAVVVELRGAGPVDSSFKLYKPKSALVPARRGSSTNEFDSIDPPMYKRRQMSRPRAGTNGSRKGRSMSTSNPMSDMGLNIKPPSSNLGTGSRFDAESERSDGYIMVTPRSEISSWPPLDATPGLDPSLTSTTPSTLSTSAGTRNAWMGAELDPSDSISQLANVHFPEIPALSDAGEAHLTHLDFMALGDGAGDWSREWNGGGDVVGVGSDLDGFPPQGGGGFGMSAWGKEGFGGMLSG